MMKTVVAILFAAAVALPTTGRTRTTQKKLGDTKAVLELIAEATSSDSAMTMPADVVTIRGYSKRASDGKESFFITNNTDSRMSQIVLKMRYSTTNGELLHERKATVDVVLAPGETRQVSIRSWDVQRLFYYYSGPKPRKSATPFKVAYRLMGYSVPVGNP